MPMNREWIVQSAEDARAYHQGETFFCQGRATLLDIDRFWRGERLFRYAVREGEDTFLSSIQICQGNPGRMTCSCRQPETGTKLCRHLVAAAFDVEKREKQTDAPAVFTSEAMRELLNDYQGRRFGEEMAGYGGETIRLLPSLHWSGEELRFGFSLGDLGRIRDLREFALALEDRQPFKAGRRYFPALSLNLFDGSDRKLAETVKDLVLDQMEAAGARKAGRSGQPGGEECLSPGRTGLDEIMECLIGRNVEFLSGGSEGETAEVVDGSPRLSLLMEKAGRDGIVLRISRQFRCARGRKHLYVCTGGKLYRADSAFSEGGGRLLLAMQKEGKDRALFLKERDLTGFYDYYRRELRTAFRVDCRDVDPEEFRPREFTAEFYVDSPNRNEITLQIKYRYGDEEISPFDYVQRPERRRDALGEKRIAGIVKQYFHIRSTERSCFVIRGDEDQMYLFLRQGIRELAGYGEIYLSERMKRTRLIAKPRVSLGVTDQGGWFNLQVDAEGMTREELEEALRRYQRRERYIRLKSGDFLNLEENGMKALAELCRGLEPADDGESLTMPRYRALYVDSLRERIGAEFTGGTGKLDEMIRRLVQTPETEYHVPESLSRVMKDYQKQGFCWMKNLDALGFGGILADDMGLGKTLQAISLLLDEAEKEENQVSLIVCPASLVYNWKYELERYAPQLSGAAVAGDADERADILKRAGSFQVLITSYDLLKRDLEQYQGIRFSYCFLDEAQYIKNHLTQNAKAVKCLQARTRFALTGTPVENRLGELWSIMDFLMPGLLYGYSRFGRELEQPIVREQDEEALSRLHRLISPFVLRRLKKDVLEELPDKLETVIYTKMEGEQKKLYATNALALRSRLTDTDDAAYRRERMQVLAELTRLRQICCDPGLCYENYQGGSAKLDACVELILRSIRGGHKILLFSQFTSMLERIGACLREKGIHYYELTGQTGKQERIELAERFHEDDVPVFLISLKAGGTGLNLTAADVVIHYDPWWNLAAQNQATDRAHRLGQKHVVSVFRLITRSTIEENILLLQENKRKLAEKMIGESSSAEAAVSRDELIALLEERRTEDGVY